MKKFFVAILILMTLFTVSYADGVWHYCDLCGREHSGTICPEQCIDPCSENEAGHIHKWYDCPEYTVTECWHCGEQTISHNANCCPEGNTIWNDVKGVFKTRKFKDEEGARLPTYCTYCEHYGYHASTECKKAPKYTNTPKPTATPTTAPTKTPKPTNTPKPTEHVHTEAVLKSNPQHEWVKTSDVCYRATSYVTVYCTTCNTVISTQENVEAFSHYFGNDRVCDYCEYGKECQHTKYTTEYLGLVCVEEFKTFSRCRNLVYGYQEVCNACDKVIHSYSETVEDDHKYRDGECVNCGFVIRSNETATLVPTATPTPVVTSAPTATPIPTAEITLVPPFTVRPSSTTPIIEADTPDNNSVMWIRVAIVLAVTFVACGVIFFAFKKK